MKNADLFIGGSWVKGAGSVDLRDKFTGAPVARVQQAAREHVDAALNAARFTQERDDSSPADRSAVLRRAAELVAARRGEFIETIVLDSGFVASDAAREVDRAIETLTISGEEAKRITGEMVPMDGSPNGHARLAFTMRVPRGIVCAITPFNSPLNTVLHKVAPALAGGNAVVLKPSEHTPLTANLIVETLLEAGLEPGMIALLHGASDVVGQALLEDERPSFYAFTGSTAVGTHIRRTIGIRPAQLELGSLASTIVCADADLEMAVPKVVSGAFRKAGQVCTSVQRLYVEAPIAQEFATRMKAALAGKCAGDPSSADSFIGPVVTPDDGARIGGIIDDAVQRGARVLTGGTNAGAVVQPTILAGVNDEALAMTLEIFGPVVSLCPFEDFEIALGHANNTPFGLAAGVFTSDLDRALYAARQLRVGAVHINETSSSRVDLMPFGGTKQSGSGLEGPRYAIREMTEERLITISSGALR